MAPNLPEPALAVRAHTPDLHTPEPTLHQDPPPEPSRTFRNLRLPPPEPSGTCARNPLKPPLEFPLKPPPLKPPLKSPHLSPHLSPP